MKKLSLILIIVGVAAFAFPGCSGKGGLNCFSFDTGKVQKQRKHETLGHLRRTGGMGRTRVVPLKNRDK